MTDKQYTLADKAKQEVHAAYIKGLVKEQRYCLEQSETARDKYFELRDAYKAEKGLTGFELDEALKLNRDAQGAVADSVLYDRWATKYAVTALMELAAYEQDLHL